MKVESTGPIKKINENQQTNTQLPKLIKGNIFISQVTENQGDSVLFKSQDGIIFMAKLLNGTQVKAGDRVEMVVKGIKDGLYILEVLDI